MTEAKIVKTKATARAARHLGRGHSIGGKGFGWKNVHPMCAVSQVSGGFRIQREQRLTRFDHTVYHASPYMLDHSSNP